MNGGAKNRFAELEINLFTHLTATDRFGPGADEGTIATRGRWMRSQH
jgi:hypothetical protein